MERLKSIMYTGIVIILIVSILSLGVWWTIYKYKDCKKVGHSTTYCILDIGK